MTISSGRSTDTSSRRSTALSRSIADGPFRRNGLLTRALPFAAVAILAEVSLALPPGPQSAGYTALSVILLVAVLVAVPLAPWNRLPQWMTVLVPVALVAWVLTLTLATGSATSGIGIVILVPLIWSVLFQKRWESFVVVVAILVTEIITSLTPVEVPGAVLSRRIVFWAAIGLLIVFSAHDLRDRARAFLLDRETVLRRTDGLAAATATTHDDLRFARGHHDGHQAGGPTRLAPGYPGTAGAVHAGQRIDRHGRRPVRRVRTDQHGLPVPALRTSDFGGGNEDGGRRQSANRRRGARTGGPSR